MTGKDTTRLVVYAFEQKTLTPPPIQVMIGNLDAANYLEIKQQYEQMNPEGYLAQQEDWGISKNGSVRQTEIEG